MEFCPFLILPPPTHSPYFKDPEFSLGAIELLRNAKFSILYLPHQAFRSLLNLSLKCTGIYFSSLQFEIYSEIFIEKIKNILNVISARNSAFGDRACWVMKNPSIKPPRCLNYLPFNYLLLFKVFIKTFDKFFLTKWQKKFNLGKTGRNISAKSLITPPSSSIFLN